MKCSWRYSIPIDKVSTHTPNNYLWRERFGWFSLVHVCRKWRATMFASASHGPKNPRPIERVLLGPFPILLKYERMYGDVTLCALWRMHSALEHRDRVREIFFERSSAWLHEFFTATNCPFPIRESLVLRPEHGDEIKARNSIKPTCRLRPEMRLYCTAYPRFGRSQCAEEKKERLLQ
jgi:hypothetical protein